MKTFQKNPKNRSNQKPKTLKEVLTMKKTLFSIISVMMLVGVFMSPTQSHAYTFNWKPINWIWFVQAYNTYVNNTMPDFVLDSVDMCLKPAYNVYTNQPIPYHIALKVTVKTKNIGGNKGVSKQWKIQNKIAAFGGSGKWDYWISPRTVWSDVPYALEVVSSESTEMLFANDDPASPYLPTHLVITLDDRKDFDELSESNTFWWPLPKNSLPQQCQ